VGCPSQPTNARRRNRLMTGACIAKLRRATRPASRSPDRPHAVSRADRILRDHGHAGIQRLRDQHAVHGVWRQPIRPLGIGQVNFCTRKPNTEKRRAEKRSVFRRRNVTASSGRRTGPLLFIVLPRAIRTRRIGMTVLLNRLIRANNIASVAPRCDSGRRSAFPPNSTTTFRATLAVRWSLDREYQMEVCQ
jgi:hypothetical protein